MDHIRNILPQMKGAKLVPSKMEKPNYNCPICKDFGKVHPKDDGGKPIYSQFVPCKCQEEAEKARRQRLMLEFCYLPSNTEHMTFANFDAYNPSLREALKAAKELADPNGELKWLTLNGGRDRGKSHLAVAICRRWLELGKPARYVFVPTMLDELRKGYSEEGEGSFDRKMDFLLCVPLLILDDLGAQVPTPWAMEKLASIINSRYESGYPLVVTTNKALNELPGDDEGRIESRLKRFTQGKVCVIDADEYRKYRLRCRYDTQSTI